LNNIQIRDKLKAEKPDWLRCILIVPGNYQGKQRGLTIKYIFSHEGLPVEETKRKWSTTSNTCPVRDKEGRTMKHIAAGHNRGQPEDTNEMLSQHVVAKKNAGRRNAEDIAS